MTPAFDHLDSGRPEQEWLADERWGSLPTLTIRPGHGLRRLVVIAAHPDDETLGAGGLLHLVAQAGVPVDVIVASDGEGSHPDSPTYDRAQLARVRRIEVMDAVAILAPAARVRHLGLPDGDLAAHAASVAAALRESVADLGVGAVIAAPWRHDGHTDHDALGAVAAQVAEQTGALLLEYPIWLWHWGSGDDVPWARMRVLPLQDEQRAAKRRALATHVSQIEPLSGAPGDEVLLGAGMLAHFDRPFETFVDSSGLAEVELFERLHATRGDPWQVRSSDYESRKRDLTVSMLPARRFARAYEPGCSVGELSAALAPHCDSLICQDLSATAVQEATARLAAYPQVQVRQGSVPRDWPEGDFDLIVLSEIGYFLSPVDLDAVLRRARMTLRSGGYVLLCHWAHPIEGWELDGRDVHARAGQLLDLPVHARHVDDDVLLEVFGPCP
ncbi:bifunctional PIG-L family deacetylase/class I SAM-dependent methyltransferase [Allobranchiibius sp. GilTou38]|uniref:bifunctional PIG-L family deacetylase/class I SAM-dependent methyltransferase n=1 Tax=Allobranchiibius sp. GilTou38 TaxID=2815210 RepID=UPI001AA11CAD|nr:bifunctional PIG-L family deacetylase/class I SAM-dependent methyltransferase [Allobranchiibius sp. GilTou38]MBO1768300.1 PIG-L family deacetylase [Allobranchiibius sp. GilTou38]